MTTAAIFLWTLLSVHGCSALLPPLAAPHNVSVVALNTNYTLTWDWEQDPAHPQGQEVTFTTQYISKFKLSRPRGASWLTACKETRGRSCDLTRFRLHHLGLYRLQVRASREGRHSNWTGRDFCPDQDAALGPPGQVVLTPAGSLLDLHIKDPVTSFNSSMRDLVPELFYLISYWEGPAHLQEWLQSSPQQRPPLAPPAGGVMVLNSSSNLVTLPGLRSWTWYCVSVRSVASFHSKISSGTAPLCRKTEGTTSWWIIFCFFLGSLLFFFLLALLLVFGLYRSYRKLKVTCFPPDQLPSHFLKHLRGPPGGGVPHLVSPDSESELLSNMSVLEVHHHLPEAGTLPPAGLEQDCSGSSSSGSSSSRDSGVFSTGGSSHLQHHQQQQQQQLKMWDAAALKLGGVAPDEGVVDVSV
ncbi:interferon alpha/beta receptor 1b-like isoform X2 [Nelusetta ayraudi]|uniref:interferon alpha/beta receptor 1b-like isoform X2 n=1 Tax=Nelusetta ayraudi TaxID=303726 RepID=UPI003F72EED1